MTLNVAVKPFFKSPLSSLASLSWNRENWKTSAWKTKNSNSIFTAQVIPYSTWQKIIFKMLFWIFDWRHQIGIREIVQLNSDKVFLWILRNLKTPYIYRMPPNNSFWIFSFVWLICHPVTNRIQVFPIFEHVLSRLSNVMNIMNFAFWKLYLGKQSTQLLLHGNHPVERRISLRHTWNEAVIFRLIKWSTFKYIY